MARRNCPVAFLGGQFKETVRRIFERLVKRTTLPVLRPATNPGNRMTEVFATRFGPLDVGPESNPLRPLFLAIARTQQKGRDVSTPALSIMR